MTAAFAGDFVSVAVNRAQLSVGATLVGSVRVDNPGLLATAAFLLGLLLPDGDTIVFFTGSGIAFGRLSSPATFQPIGAGIPLATPFAVTVPSFLTHTWTGSELRGTYVFFLAALRSGALADGAVESSEVLALSVAAFAFSP